ncbi:MAG: PQQ-binding-like beta-propeller repeat protein [Planctomycetaceae bacterium]
MHTSRSCFVLTATVLLSLPGDPTPAVQKAKPTSESTLQALWNDLGRSDRRGDRALWRLLEADPRKATAFLFKRLKPVTLKVDTKRVAGLIRKLDAAEYRTRQNATKALEKIGPAAVRQLKQAERQTKSPEVRARARRLLERLQPRQPTTPEQRRAVRAIRALEHFGSSKAQLVLARMAKGHAFAPETRRAKQALERLRLFGVAGSAVKTAAPLRVGRFDWPQWGGTTFRNNTPVGVKIPTYWDVKTGKNIKWKAKLGSQTYGNPVVANGRVYVGTNNGAGWIKRFPPRMDLGVLLCFDEQTGKFLWQYSSKKLVSGRVNDWPEQGLCASPVVDGDRLWVVTNRCEVVCLDTAGFHDGRNDGPFREEDNENRDEADVVWKFDMMKRLGVSPHNMSTCSIITAGGRLFVCTSNGVDNSHVRLPSPKAPSFICLDRETGKVLWKDSSPGRYIVHGQWASPGYLVIGKQPQVLFPGGDGWLYSFDPRGDGKGSAKLLWKFDCNPKESKWILGGRGTRNNLIGFPCVYQGLIYIAVGQDPEHGEGDGRMWCINPTKKLDGSDVSPTLAVDRKGKPLPRRRLQAVNPAAGEKAIKNPDSAVVWHFAGQDDNGDGALEFEEEFHRSIGTPVIKDDILYIADFSGLVHCIDAKTGRRYWQYDMFAASWGSALVVDGKVYIGDEDGDIAIFPHTRDPKKALKAGPNGPMPALGEVPMLNAVYSTPIVANNVLFITNKNTLYAIVVMEE